MNTMNTVILKGCTVMILAMGLSSLCMARGNENSDLITVNWVDKSSGQSINVTLPQHMPLSALKVKMLGTSQVSASEKDNYNVTTCDSTSSNRRGGWGRRGSSSSCTDTELNESLNMLALGVEDGDTLYLNEATTTTTDSTGNTPGTGNGTENGLDNGQDNGKHLGWEKGKRLGRHK